MIPTNKLIIRIKQNLLAGHYVEIEQAKQVMGDTLLDCIREDYRLKAAGKIGSDGISWLPTEKFLRTGKPMLIQSGRLIAGFRFVPTDKGFKIVNDVEYASRQFSVRPPWPVSQRIPTVWLQRMLEAGRPYIIQAAIRATKSAIEQVSRSRVKRIQQ